LELGNRKEFGEVTGDKQFKKERKRRKNKKELKLQSCI
jgi:hypothetical protein